MFDVGANIGEYSEYALSLNNEINIHCFEPVNNTFFELKKKKLNSKTVFNHVALSDTLGEMKMYIYGELGETNSLNFHQNLSDYSPMITTEIIKLETLDNYMITNNIQYVNFLKIDTEGHELNVLKGAEKCINNSMIGVIQFEYNYLWENTANRLKDVFKLLEKNYDIFRLTPWGKIKIKKWEDNLENYPKASNYVAVKKYM